MKRNLVWALPLLALSSCDKAKEAVAKAQVAVELRVEEVKESINGPSEVPADAALQSLVDQNEQGYVFRKDLPFPSRLKVKIVEKTKFDGMIFRSNLMERGAGPAKGEFQTEREFEKLAGSVTADIRDIGFLPWVAEGTDPLPRQLLHKGARIHLEQKDGKWVLAPGKAPDFAAVALMDGRNTAHDLARDCVMPRTFWFGKNRLKIGDELVLSGPHLAMLGFFEGKGEIKVKFEAVEPVAGHPCGRFSISGLVDHVDAGMVGESGSSGQLTIESGSIWFSLVYPIIPKEEMHSVITIKSGQGKQLSNQIQGKASSVTERSWTVLPPPAS